MRKMTLLASSFSFLVVTNLAHAAPVVVSEGVAPPLEGQGTGLCEASATSMSPTADFGLLNPNAFLSTVNTFLDARAADRVERTIRTPFDLSNNNSAGPMQSYGDFVDAALPTCKTGGCDFTMNDPATSFASRYRGYFNVTADLANKPIHFGLLTDDAVGLVIYDKADAAHPVVVRPAAIGLPTWRVTNEVTFMTPGLYPIEVVYVEISEHAALEMSYFVGDFVDFERAANQPPIVKLGDAGFTLIAPTAFFQTLSGNPSFPDLAKCQQCDRAKVNQAGANGCLDGYHCNDAALCAPCDTNRFCGATCAPCGGDTPFCVNVNGSTQCGGCRTDADCASGATCNPDSKTCNDGSSNGAGGAGGAGGNGGNGGDTNSPSEGGCDCRTVSSSSHSGMPAMIGFALAGIGTMRRRQRRDHAKA